MRTFVTLDESFFGTELSESANDFKIIAEKQLQALEDKTCVDAGFTGWYGYPQTHGFRLADEIAKSIEELDVAYDLVLVIGIGGSYLGTRAVVEALQHSYQGVLPSTQPLVTYLGHHLSPTAMIEVLELLADRLPLVNVISKSGTTTEPSVAFRVVKQYMEKRFGKHEASKRIIVTTDKEKGALRQLSEEEGYQSFVVPDDIGGRFSVLSAVGLLPLALAKVDTHALLRGADLLFSELKQTTDHPVIRYASLRNAAYKAGKKIEILAYSNPKFSYFVEWWKQLFGESEGKEGKGLFPSGIAYTTDLHSLGQYVQDGERIIIETFLRFDEEPYLSEGYEKLLKVPVTGHDNDKIQYLEGKDVAEINKTAMEATKIAHYDGGVPCIEMFAPTLNEESIGYLFAFFETACAVSGLTLGINPFNQPGVEAYKKNLFALMGRPGFEALKKELIGRSSKD